MKASELIQHLHEMIKKHGDRPVCIRGSSNGTFAYSIDKPRLGARAETKDKICITGGY